VNKNNKNKNLILLGTGFAGFSCLKKLEKTSYNVSVVSPRNHFLFTPLLPSTTVGTIEFRSIIEPVRNIKNIEFYKSYCIAIDPVNKFITCREIDTPDTFRLPYDILVIAAGEITNTFNIEGVKEYAFFLKEIADARKIRTKVIECFEQASLPDTTPEQRKQLLTFVVCGGGPTGVEFAAELHDFIEEDVTKKYKKLTDYTLLVLIEAGTGILNSFDSKLSEYTMKLFRRHKIDVRTNSRITKVNKENIILKDGSSVPYGVLVWATGNTAIELVQSCELPKNNRDKIIVDGFFHVKGYDDLYAVGDCCEYENEMYPATAQVAQQEGRYLAGALNRLAKNKNVKPFKFKNLGMLAYVGGNKALADTPQYKGSGFTTFLFWRSVYLTKLVSLKNKILVLFDWFKNFIFGRDVSNF